MTEQTILGIDLGGTHLRIAAIEVKPNGYLKMREQSIWELDRPQSWADFVRELQDYKDEISQTDGCALSIAGSIDEHSKVTRAPNVPFMDGQVVPVELSRELDLDEAHIVVANDMEAAAHAEKTVGVLQDCNWAIFDTISTGWGGALILNGEVVVGEPGHVNLGFSLPYVCGCGNVGCLEALYSGSAMVRRIRQHLDAQGILFPSDLDAKIWEYFAKELETEAAWAVSLIDEWGEAVGRAWANVLNRIQPIQRIAYMGPTANALIPKAMDRIRATMRRVCMFSHHKDPTQLEILPAEASLGSNRSIYGAAVVYQDKLGTQGGMADAPAG